MENNNEKKLYTLLVYSENIAGILNELNKGGLINGAVKRVDGKTLDEQMKKYDITGTEIDAVGDEGTFLAQVTALDVRCRVEHLLGARLVP